jgi:clorobiocin biosynthesis protein CloN6
MTNDGLATVPRVRADLLLVHAPAFFDFRNREDIYFPYLSSADAVPITPLYEYFPVGFKTLQRFLGDRGHDVRIVNLCTVLLKYPGLDIRALIQALDVKLIGIDLHWMVHVQGCLEIASLIKAIRPEVPIIFGGISSTYYAQELIRYPFIDMVMCGYDTHEPMAVLLDALKGGQGFHNVPNLLWKKSPADILDNGFTHTPDTFSCGINWSTSPRASQRQTAPILEFLSLQNTGCAYNCGWCGGSRDAFRRINKRRRAMARKPLAEVAYELRTVTQIPGQDTYHFYSANSYNESRESMAFFLDRIGETSLKSISYEQFHLTPDDVVQHMARVNRRTTITLSPESHDMRVAKLAGRGVYTPQEMEAWIERALGYGIFEIDIWYFIGMPEQDEQSVMETVDYCHHLLRRFKGKRVMPLICPMIPFLDPASTFFEEPESHGYRVFYRSVEEHRRAMMRASLINRINYETRWLSREDLVRVGYTAVRRLTEAKADVGFFPRGIAQTVLRRIDDALGFIGVVHEIDCIANEEERARQLRSIGAEIRLRNDEIFFTGVANQAFPLNRQIGGRWFDELLWDAAELESAHAAAQGAPDGCFSERDRVAQACL